MKKRLGCGLLLLLVLSGLALGAGWVFLRVPAQAVARFGEPSSNLGTWERWRLSYTLLSRADALTAPIMPNDGERVSITVPAGATAAEVATRLQQQGLLADAAAFLAYLRYKGWDTRLQAGTFRLDAPLTPLALASSLTMRPETEAVLVILPGWRREEVAEAVVSSGLRFSPEAFLQATARAHDYLLPVEAPEGATLEGFLFPGKYALARTATPAEVAAAAIANGSEWFSPAWQQAVQAHGLTPYQAVVLASIVQRETAHTDEMPRIAAVYLNRLARQMPLEADPTVQYALGRPGAWWPTPLALTDLQVDSPYNTYTRPGLPPTPICNPGPEALQAVASAPQTNDLFFRAACDGSGYHVFSETFGQHLNNDCP